MGPTRPPSQWAPGVFTTEAKRPGREAEANLQSAAIYPLPQRLNYLYPLLPCQI